MVHPVRQSLTRALALLALSGLVLGCGDDNGSGGFSAGDDLVISVLPNPVSFGAIAVTQHADQLVTITHVGSSGTIRLRRVWLESDSTELAITQPDKTALEVGEQTTVLINYDPVDSALDRGTLKIETNIAAESGALTVEVPIETVSQVGFLRAIPNPVDFGDVEGGDVETKIITLVNIGSDDLTVREVLVKPGADGDFTLKQAPAPATYRPEEQFSIEVDYAPTNGGADTGRVEVVFEVDGETKTVDPPITLLGREVGPKLTVFPNPMDFGWRASGVMHTLPLTVSNQGSRALTITDLSLASWSDATVAFTGGSTAGGAITVEPGALLPLTIQFTPTNDMIQTTSPIAALDFTSNDAANGGQTSVNIFGRAEAPVLQVNPPDLVDFGYVAQNVTQVRRVSLYNAGSATLNVTSIGVSDNPTGEYAVKVDEGWGPTASSPSAGTIEPGDFREVSLTFTNDGASSGTQWGKLLIVSDDGQTPSWEVELKAQRAGAPTCELALVPAQLDFGTVPRGNKRTMTINIVNVGSGDCSFHSAFVNDCASFFGFFDGSCDDPANTVLTSGTSDYYKVTSTPLAIAGGLRAGQSYPMEVTFTPPDSAPIFGDELVDYAGLVAVRAIDPYSGSTTPIVFPAAQGGGLSPYPPNLHAKSGVARLAVLPSEVDFGLTTIGCHSQTITVTAYNVGSAELNVSNVEMQGCTPEFKIKALPGLPLLMQPQDSFEVEVVYAPQDTGGDACGLTFFTEGDTPEIVVPLEGGGTYDTEHTDTFVQTTGQDVDVLFVVDNSGSMSDEQNNLSSNFSAFIQGAATWSNDYHVGVTSTDEDDGGRLLYKSGSTRYVTDANWQDFEDNVKIGDNGAATEQGMFGAQSALTLPLTANSQTACTTDTACADPERCVDGFCGGANRGFLREEAALEIVFVSDEEDQSPADLNFYINFFKSIKGFYNDNLFHAHAIVGPAGGCDSQFGSASAGLRYIDLANATGGSVQEICDQTFSSGLAAIGDIAFGLRTQFFLSRTAEPSTIEITVAGAGCLAQNGTTVNWTYEPNSNSVVFNEAGGCMPQATQTIDIYYETTCYLE